VVGVADYENNVSGLIDLTWTTEDSKKFSEFLMTKEGGSVPAANIYLLNNEKAKKANIIYYAKQLFSKAKEEDRVIFFFSGHGMPGAFIPYDFEPITSSNYLSYQEVKEIFRTSKSKTKLLFADACYAGELKNNQKAVKEFPISQEKSSNETNILIMLSCAPDETSLESTYAKQSLFAYFLIHGLKGYADKNKDKNITAEELHRYVYNKTSKAAEKLKGKQHPTTFGSFDKNLVVGSVFL
jgi:uncharacterized caspase-like protein